MAFSSKLSLSSLIEFCRILRHNLGAGLTLQHVFRQQAERGPLQVRPVAARISEEIDKGESLEAALRNEPGVFPAMFVSMVVVGEQSGCLPEVLAELEKYFLLQQKLRRQFISQIAWPVLEYLAAGLVIGLMIVFLSILSPANNKPFDPLGFGLTGFGGAITFMIGYYGIGAVLIGGYYFLTRTLNKAVTVHQVLLRLPAFGPCLSAVCMLRFCVALRLTMETGMSILKAMRLSLRATGNPAFESQADTVHDALRSGEELTLALSRTHVFPQNFLDIMANAEEGGRMSEVLENQAEFYEDETRRRMTILSRVAGWGVYALIGLTLIFMIFRIFLSIYGGGGVYDRLMQ